MPSSIPLNNGPTSPKTPYLDSVLAEALLACCVDQALLSFRVHNAVDAVTNSSCQAGNGADQCGGGVVGGAQDSRHLHLPHASGLVVVHVAC